MLLSASYSSSFLFFHCIPALCSGIVGVILAGLSEDGKGVLPYHNSLYHIYPARIPTGGRCGHDGAPCRAEIISSNPFLETKGYHGRTALRQALHQVRGTTF